MAKIKVPAGSASSEASLLACRWPSWLSPHMALYLGSMNPKVLFQGPLPRSSSKDPWDGSPP